jgi:ADP-dependent NAD(P)H-hydrate dehydratase / NAD(P)H-hydrate epimerase
MQDLPDKLYRVDSVVQLEQITINQFGVPAYELMKRAGQTVFEILRARYSQHKNILVLCGAGNNAGDGYVVARIASQSGLSVSVISLIDPETLKNEALQAYRDWSAVGENEVADISLLEKADIVIDALLGTGLKREVSADWLNWIEAVNNTDKPVVSVDIPSGLMADTGAIAGTAIEADLTVCFIGLKQGLFTAQGKDVCGEIIFDDLAVPDVVYSVVEADARLVNSIDHSLLPVRKASSHKGKFGHVLIAGGNKGMPGAVILAAKAALRTGAGLVTIITVADNLTAICSAVPEAMVKICDSGTLTEVFSDSSLNSVSHVAVGMGLGQDDWSLAVLHHSVAMNKAMLIDADALNLIAQHKIDIQSSLVITPHPGEAARLLSGDTQLSSADIQQDRFTAVKKLHKLVSNREPCVVILKGSGTIIFDGHVLKVCSSGNAAMAAPGMGDVLSGITIALLAQGISTSNAAELAVCLHASAADHLTDGRTRGLLATDIIDALPGFLQ